MKKNKQEITLGIQANKKRVVPKSIGGSASWARTKQSTRAFPSPPGHHFVSMLYIAVLLVVGGAFLAVLLCVFANECVYSGYLELFLGCILSITPVWLALAFLYPVFNRWLARKGSYTATAKVIAVDRAGILVNDDAQQRALVEVVQGKDCYWFVADQHGLCLVPGTSVTVSWRDNNAQVCWIHDV